MNIYPLAITLAAAFSFAPAHAASDATSEQRIVTLETVQVRPSMAQQAEAAMRPIIDLAAVQVRPNSALRNAPALVQQVMEEPITAAAYHAGQVLLPYLELPHADLLPSPAALLGGAGR
jgi:hypothetical protein